jgi:photosystem II stability/assembly factor-like uncharacterized protein
MVKDEFSPFKRHSGWFSQRACQYSQDAHPGQIEAHWAALKEKGPERHAMQWECLGPFNIAGRMTALIAHPADAKRLYAGAAAGGVWTSADGGLTWRTNWPKWFSQSIGALAFDAANPKIIYCASGEANISPDCYPGSGLYVSRDGGVNWEELASAEDQVLPRRIGALVSSPHTPSLLYLGGVNLDESQPGGIYRSCDGGKNWTREDGPSKQNYWCHAIAIHPDGTVFAALEMHGWQTGIYRLDAGDSQTWKQLHGGLPPGDKTGRISLAIAPLKPDTIYALVSDPMGNEVLGVYRSPDRGNRWTEIGGDDFSGEDQGCYNNTIAVHPKDPDTVVCGLVDVHITRDGGATWTRASHWDAGEDTPQYVHGDQHAILLPGGDLIYAANDGGVAVSEDIGASWQCRGKGLVTTMFYDIDVSPVNGKLLGGGAQDNGSLMTGPGVTEKEGEYLRVLDGDGAWMVFDPAVETHVFGSKSDIHIFRHASSLHWAEDFWQEVSPKGLNPSEHKEVAIAVLAIDPHNGHKVWAGSRRLWVTKDDGREWEAVSLEFDGSAITAIEIPASAPGQVLVGTKRGGIFRSLDDGKNWSGDLSGPEMPSRVITRIETHPRKASRVVVTVGGTGSTPRAMRRAMRYGAEPLTSGAENFTHVFLSDDGGLTWRAIDGPDMPQVAYHAAVFETHEPHRLFVSTDCGVWMTADLAAWTDVSTTLPNVMISDLVYHDGDRTLTAATHGRGIWRAAVPPLADTTNAEVKR